MTAYREEWTRYKFKRDGRPIRVRFIRPTRIVRSVRAK